MSQRSNPFEEIERFFNRMSRQFDEASSRWESERPFGQWSSAFESMSIDLVDHDDEFVVTVDLPGFERDDVDLRVTDSTLAIEAEREEEIEEGEEHYLRRERRRESAERKIQLPEEVDAEAVTAEMQNGVLTITLPKLESAEAHTIEIQ